MSKTQCIISKQTHIAFCSVGVFKDEINLVISLPSPVFGVISPHKRRRLEQCQMIRSIKCDEFNVIITRGMLKVGGC